MILTSNDLPESANFHRTPNSIKLSERQRELLQEIAASCDRGLIWIAHLSGCYGGGDAAAIKALHRKGYAKPYEGSDGRVRGYDSVITDEGRAALAA